MTGRRAKKHLPPSLTAVSKVISATEQTHIHTLGAALFPSFSPCVTVKLRMLYKRQSKGPHVFFLFFFYYVSMFFCVWMFGWSETLGSRWTHGYLKDTATLGSALKQRRQSERLLLSESNFDCEHCNIIACYCLPISWNSEAVRGAYTALGQGFGLNVKGGVKKDDALLSPAVLHGCNCFHQQGGQRSSESSWITLSSAAKT